MLPFPPLRTAAHPQCHRVGLQRGSGNWRGLSYPATTRHNLQQGQHQLQRGSGDTSYALPRSAASTESPENCTYCTNYTCPQAYNQCVCVCVCRLSQGPDSV